VQAAESGNAAGGPFLVGGWAAWVRLPQP